MISGGPMTDMSQSTKIIGYRCGRFAPAAPLWCLETDRIHGLRRCAPSGWNDARYARYRLQASAAAAGEAPVLLESRAATRWPSLLREIALAPCGGGV